jgi:hypothetical protein
VQGIAARQRLPQLFSAFAQRSDAFCVSDGKQLVSGWEMSVQCRIPDARRARDVVERSLQSVLLKGRACSSNKRVIAAPRIAPFRRGWRKR